MAWTYATLSAALMAYLQSSEGDFVDYLPTFVQQAEDRISKSVILPANRKNAAVAFSTGVQTAPLAADFLAPFELRSVVSNVYTPVAYVDVSLIREAFPSPATLGVPRYYSMLDDTTIILGPTPDSTVQGYMRYFYKPESIVTAETSWLGTNAENCLLYACLSEAYTFLKGDPDLMKLYEDKYQMALADLKILGEGMDMGDAFRMGERRIAR